MASCLSFPSHSVHVPKYKTLLMGAKGGAKGALTGWDGLPSPEVKALG
eukprot:CAMPEP_0117657188 /NCGR_PEP_ID=MMETSP0804-20121206/5199_1 /TAXON_ID=1074897 /ORGANISM="Tetraselmis astigmatica, Strain CCMP880" /LENGTH=47 /DNA_ID= /DNA_START= /DNA_END= /DNA_ORIENTATION=